jgi:hypothetical protein
LSFIEIVALSKRACYSVNFVLSLPFGGWVAHGDCNRLQQRAFWECAEDQTARNQVQRGLGGALIQQWCLWLVNPPPAVCEMVWQEVASVAVWATEEGRIRL